MKSVYSLVLSDEIIAEIDKAAFKSGVSRSQYVNDVLAAAVGIDTTEKLIDKIFDKINIAAGELENFRVQRGSQTAVDFLSSLNFKYSPKVTYSVVLYADDGLKGELKIALRTTNPLLIDLTRQFFNDFNAIERAYNANAEYYASGGRLVRKFSFKNDSDVSGQITDYVHSLDRLFNEYIAFYGEDSFKRLERGYLKLMDKMNI